MRSCTRGAGRTCQARALLLMKRGYASTILCSECCMMTTVISKLGSLIEYTIADQINDPLHAIDLCLRRIVPRGQWKLDSHWRTLFPVAYHSYWIMLFFFAPHDFYCCLPCFSRFLFESFCCGSELKFDMGETRGCASIRGDLYNGSFKKYCGVHSTN